MLARPRRAAAPAESRSDLDTSKNLDYHPRVTTSTPVRTRRRAKPDLDRAETLFHALSDATRLAILEMLRGGERCVCDLQADLDAAQSKLSFHLKVLKDAGLVTDRREGRWSYYEIVPQALAEVHDLAVGLQPKKGTLRVLQAGSCCD
jgi:ArsR family transcriptional regulator